MDSKLTIYISIVISSWFIGFLIPFNIILGAPLSLVTLAYFSQYLKTKITLLVFGLLSIANIVVEPQVFLSLIFFGERAIAFLDIGSWFSVIWITLGTLVGRFISMQIAMKIIMHSKLWKKYPV